LLSIYSQYAILKIKRAKIIFFLRLSIAIISKNKEKYFYFYTWFKNVSQNIKRCFKILLLYLASSLIRLNLPVDHRRHFGYNTKLQKKKKLGTSTLWSSPFPSLSSQLRSDST
jgi:hypothetical protein